MSMRDVCQGEEQRAAVVPYSEERRAPTDLDKAAARSGESVVPGMTWERWAGRDLEKAGWA